MNLLENLKKHLAETPRADVLEKARQIVSRKYPGPHVFEYNSFLDSVFRFRNDPSTVIQTGLKSNNNMTPQFSGSFFCNLVL